MAWARHSSDPLLVAAKISSVGYGVVMGPLDKRPEARQVLTMGFGPFRVKAKFGELRIATSAAAMAFVRSLEPSHRASYHWKVAERMIHFAWMSAEDEALAEQAFMIALETDALLIP
jgi:hypothetical protein